VPNETPIETEETDLHVVPNRCPMDFEETDFNVAVAPNGISTKGPNLMKYRMKFQDSEETDLHVVSNGNPMDSCSVQWKSDGLM